MAEIALENYLRLPPIARTVATATLLLSLGIHTRLISGSPFVYFLPALWKFPPQIWRVVTCFLITGPQLGIIFDTYFLYSYLQQLEVGHPRFSRREDVIWYLMFVSGTILMLNHLTGFGFAVFTKALILAICYTVTQDQPGMKTNYMFINIPSQAVPYAMILINLLFPGGYMEMLLQLHGLFAAHLYTFLTRIWPEFGGGRNVIPAPAFLSRVRAPRVLERTFGTAIRQPDEASGTSTGASRGPLPESWRTRGPGQRLG